MFKFDNNKFITKFKQLIRSYKYLSHFNNCKRMYQKYFEILYLDLDIKIIQNNVSFYNLRKCHILYDRFLPILNYQ